MTRRIKGFVVTLAADLREDDAAALEQALRLLQGVVDVRPVGLSVDDTINRARIARELERKLWAVLYEHQEGTP